MNLTPQEMAREVAATGFGAEPLEKVFRLMALLDALNSHPFLKTRTALKGGTALNLFHFDVPRLSVDIDLYYIGAADRNDARRTLEARILPETSPDQTKFVVDRVHAWRA
jgi:predicted nucleotidyltransferase component of viral defense system